MLFSVLLISLFFILGYFYLTPTRKTATESPKTTPLPVVTETPITIPPPTLATNPIPKSENLPKLTPTAQVLKPRGTTYQVKKVSLASVNKENNSSLGTFLLQETQKCVETLKTVKTTSNFAKNLNPLANSFIPS